MKSRRARGPAPGAAERRLVRAALAHGRQRVADLRAARRRGGGDVPRGSQGLVIAEGDSWFDYPFFDVLGALEERHGFRVESVAHRGDSAESMAWDPSQLARSARLFERLAREGATPRAILLSAGGNDVAGEELRVLLNHAASGLPALNDKVVDGVLGERVRFALASVIASLSELSKEHFRRAVPVLVHGYDHPVPDGRGYAGGFWFLPGPWLQPAFHRKGHTDLARNALVMRELMDRFNALLATLPAHPGLGHVTHLDLRGTLVGEVRGARYRQHWGDELHPTRAGFAAIAQRFADALSRLPHPRA